MPRVLITGGSGFIGTNLVEHFLGAGAAVLNIDARPPRNRAHGRCWRELDILDAGALKRAFREFAPSHLVHMAARTDLAGRSIEDYAANTAGVANVIEAVAQESGLRRVLFASSMLVCRPGYRPAGPTEYAPSTPYGESKVAGEKLVRGAGLQGKCWTLVRPTSIWGPWFGEPYADFFHAVLKGRFVKFAGGGSTKTFGYVGNTVLQVDALLRAPEPAVHGQTFYLGDRPALQIDAWADAVAAAAGVRTPRRVPLGVARAAALAGDALQALGMRPPLTSFRLANMTTDNVMDVDPVCAIAGPPPFSLENGIAQTLEWMSRGRGRS